MTAIQIRPARTTKRAMAASRSTAAMVPYAALCLSGVLLIFGSAIWSLGSEHSAGHIVMAAGAVIAPFAGLDLIRRANRSHR